MLRHGYDTCKINHNITSGELTTDLRSIVLLS